MSKRLTPCLIAATVVSSGALSPSFLHGPAVASEPATSESVAPGIVMKVDPGEGCGLDGVLTGHGLAVETVLLGSRGIFLVRPNANDAEDVAEADKVVKELAKDPCVRWAEIDHTVKVADSQFHSWPYGPAATGSSGLASWRNQPAAAALGLEAAHTLSHGEGVIVAVLDTGVDTNQPALAGKLMPGWDYVDDDAEPDEESVGVATGHGTFVAGTVSLVAPAARILPLRVLDGDGVGTAFAVAEAIDDAVAEGAGVINLSFGTTEKLDSRVLKDAIKAASKAGVVIVGAAGNDGTETKTFPASMPQVLSVGALDATQATLTAFSARGGWVSVGALGTELVGPMPGGTFAEWSGTSMAAPVVSGQVALLAAVAPDLKASKLEESIEKTARRLEHKEIRFGQIDVLQSLMRVLR